MLHEIDAFGDGAGGTTGARHATIGGIVKIASDERPYDVANEYICGRLGLMMGLPVPPGALVETKLGLGYLSLRFGRRNETPPMAIPEHVIEDHPSFASGAIVFDTWIANEDRDPFNLAYSRAGRIPPSAFDHADALFGPDQVTDLAKRLDRPIQHGCLLPLLKDVSHLPTWTGRVKRIDDGMIRALCDEVAGRGLLSRADARLAHDFLAFRRGRISELIDRLRVLLTSATSWPLLP